MKQADLKNQPQQKSTRGVVTVSLSKFFQAKLKRQKNKMT